MKKPQQIHLTFTLDAHAADALTQFLKRVAYNDYRAQATSDEEAYRMQHAGEAVRAVLAKNGISPR